MNEIILTKDSSSEEIKQYFNTILKLSKANEEFPVNLDEVWPLVYNRKSEAVGVLQKDFMQLPENESLRQNPQRSDYDYAVIKERIPAGHTVSIKENYHLSIPCLEFFIARKVRDVFEVYRQVFHKVTERSQKLSGAEFLLEQAKLMVEQEHRLANVEKRLDSIEQEREENTKALLSVTISSEQVPEISLRDKVRQLVNKYASVSNINQQDVWHKIYDQLYYLYHISIRSYKKKSGESNLDVAERNHLLEKMYNVISNMIRERNVS